MHLFCCSEALEMCEVKPENTSKNGFSRSRVSDEVQKLMLKSLRTFLTGLNTRL